MNYLVSGSSNGFGKYLAKKFQSDIYNRHDKYIFNYKDKTHYQSIIHCAFGRPEIGEKESDFRDRQLDIAEDLLKCNHSKFIFISSIDTNALELTLYAKAKIAVENLIKKSSDLYLIIKPGSLFGDGMKLNTIIKVALNKDKPLTLSAESSFYPVFYGDIEELINEDKEGIYSLIPNEKITLMEISKEFN